MSVHVADEQMTQALTAAVERHRALYDGPEIDMRLEPILRAFPQSKLSEWDLLRILRTSRSVFFDTHVEMVSGHHTATFLRFESIAQVPQLIRLIARDMADWIRQTYQQSPVAGIVAPMSEARHLAEAVADLLHDQMRLRVVLTPFDHATGKIGTQIMTGAVRTGERFLALNDVTTRGNCVSKLGKVITDQGGVVAGMLVFARRDSGQFPLMAELTAKLPFYYTADLAMPQWEPEQCPLCAKKQPLFFWKDMPEF
jgi:orotate phosphoribosyltransferase